VQVLRVSVVAVSLKGRIEAATASPAAPKPSAPRLEAAKPAPVSLMKPRRLSSIAATSKVCHTESGFAEYDSHLVWKPQARSAISTPKSCRKYDPRVDAGKLTYLSCIATFAFTFSSIRPKIAIAMQY
jgi:hypothetical protein